MSEADKKADKEKGVWFVYDGECPLCTSAAHALKIKQQYGQLHLINAREAANDPLVQEITRRGLDLDEGMVIYAEDRFYHGKGALKFMARTGDPGNPFMALCKTLFWSDALSKLTYPWMRGARNALLRRRKVGRIDNLNLKSEPIFKSIFGASWDDLPPVIKKHYANRPYTSDRVTVEGTLNTFCAGPVKWFAPLFWLMRGIPPHTENAVPVTVHFDSDPETKAFHFNRVFHFKTVKPYSFKSRMAQIKGSEVIELMRFGVGWRMDYVWEDGRVKLKHKGYALSAFGHLIPLPLTMLMGKGYAEEIPVDDDTFDMFVHITHPLWGKVYEYKGRFAVSEKC